MISLARIRRASGSAFPKEHTLRVPTLHPLPLRHPFLSPLPRLNRHSPAFHSNSAYPLFTTAAPANPSTSHLHPTPQPLKPNKTH